MRGNGRYLTRTDPENSGESANLKPGATTGATTAESAGPALAVADLPAEASGKLADLRLELARFALRPARVDTWKAGQRVRGRYVESIGQEAQPAEFWIAGFRDLLREPLSPDEFLAAPLAVYGRHGLVDTLGRSWWLNAMAGRRRDVALRWGLFDGARLAERVAGEWGPVVRDREELARLLRKWRLEDFAGWRIGVYADDLGLVPVTG